MNSIQTKLDWDFGKKPPQINPERLKEKILRSFFDAGFVIDFGNGIVAETYDEFLKIDSILKGVKTEGKLEEC